MLTSDKLNAILVQLPLRELIVRTGGRWPQLIGVVASPDFEGKNEAVRQAQIWHHMHEHLAPGEGSEIEFIFTFTPDELHAADQAERQTA